MIDKETIRHIAKLARIGLSPEEEESCTTELGRILDYFQALQAVDTDNVEPEEGTQPAQGLLRDDQPAPSVPHGIIMKNTTHKVEGFYKVPRIIE